MSAGGLELYAQGKQAWALGDLTLARQLLEQACALMPAHGAAHHLLAKSLALLGDSGKAEALQRRSCELDPRLGWNWFALAEHLENRQLWADASAAYQRAFEALPQESWIQQLAIHASQKDVLGGEDLSQGLGPQAYRHWCEQLEPRFPSALVPVRQSWVVIRSGDRLENPLPLDGWLVLLGSLCVLRPQSLQALEAWLEQRSHLLKPQLITADEDVLDSQGIRCDPWFKPATLAESSWSTPWLESFTAWSCAWLRHQGLATIPSNSANREAWIWAALRAHPRHAHVPSVLVHRRPGDGESCGNDRFQQANNLKYHLEQLGEQIIHVNPHSGRHQGFDLEWAVPKEARCTAIVPTRNRADLLHACLNSCEQTTAGGAVQLDWIVVDNGSEQAEMADLVAAWQQRLGDRFRVLSDPRPFNWSSMNNQSVRHSSADLLLFINNDVEARHRGWLEEMASQAMRPAVGCVGAILLYPSGLIQHAGVVVAMASGAEHAYRYQHQSHQIHRGRSEFLSDWGAVTGACLMVRRELFVRSGGFDTALPVEYNDIDFCLRLGDLGYRHVVSPNAVLIHYECESRDPLTSRTAASALALMQARWGHRLRDPTPWWPEAVSQFYWDGRPRGLDFPLPYLADHA